MGTANLRVRGLFFDSFRVKALPALVRVVVRIAPLGSVRVGVPDSPTGIVMTKRAGVVQW
jgi:hypothetical protein